jgi:hypothetical protein
MLVVEKARRSRRLLQRANEGGPVIFNALP